VCGLVVGLVVGLLLSRKGAQLALVAGLGLYLPMNYLLAYAVGALAGELVPRAWPGPRREAVYDNLKLVCAGLVIGNAIGSLIWLSGQWLAA
jgi:uncharacterized oligopeptide transporter (OPT) family protein